MSKSKNIIFVGMLLSSFAFNKIEEERKIPNISIIRPNEEVRFNYILEDDFNTLKKSIKINTLSTQEDQEILYDLFPEYDIEQLKKDINRFYINYSAVLPKGFISLNEYYKSDFNFEPFTNDNLISKISTTENGLMTFIKVFGDDFDLIKPSVASNQEYIDDYNPIMNKQDDFRRAFSNKFKLYYYNELLSKDFVNLSPDNNLNLLIESTPVDVKDVDKKPFKITKISIIKEFNNKFYLLSKDDFGVPFKLLQFNSLEDLKLYAKYFSSENNSLFINEKSFQIAKSKI